MECPCICSNCGEPFELHKGKTSVLNPKDIICESCYRYEIKQVVKISDLKKGDVFVFNDERYTVSKKYRNDDSPLLASSEYSWRGSEMFHNEDMPVFKLPKSLKHD